MTHRLQAALVPGVTLLVVCVLFWVVPAAHGQTLTASGVQISLQTFAAYGLIALALGIGMVAGQFDLSTLGVYAFSGMVAVKIGNDSVVLGLLCAIGVGLVAGVIQGTLVSRLGLDSTSVTLGGLLTLLGLTRIVGHDHSVPFKDFRLGARLDQQFLEVLSWRIAIVLACFAVAAIVLAYTRYGREVRAVGADPNAARIAGVRSTRIVVSVFATSGMLSAVAGALNAFTLATALPDPGFAPLVFGVTAGLLGGVSLSGGRGGAIGIAAGAIALSLLQGMFGLIAAADWVSAVVTGGLLVVGAIVAAPRLSDHVANARARWRARSDRAAAPGEQQIERA